MQSDSYLQGLVVAKSVELGPEQAAGYFGVSPALVRQWVKGSKTPSLAAVERVFQLPEPPSGPKDASWAGKEVFIGFPTYRHTNPGTLFSLLAIWDRAKFGFGMRYGDAFIVHARNRVASDYLSTNLPFCLWIDDDVVVPLGNAQWFNHHTGLNLPEKFAGLHTPNRLRSHNLSFVGALYFQRTRAGKALYAEAAQETPAGKEENERAHGAPFDEVRATDWVATGCLWTARQVYADIMARFPHLAPQHPSESFHFFSAYPDGVMSRFAELKQMAEEAAKQIKGGSAETAGQLVSKIHTALQHGENEIARFSRLEQGEDVTFSRRAFQAGHQPHVDFGCVCGHVGTCVYGPHNTKG